MKVKPSKCLSQTRLFNLFRYVSHLSAYVQNLYGNLVMSPNADVSLFLSHTNMARVEHESVGSQVNEILIETRQVTTNGLIIQPRYKVLSRYLTFGQ